MSIILFANRAATTLAGAISNTATSALLAPGSGSLFPSPGAGQFFCLSFTDATTGLDHEIVHVTAKSGDTVTIVRGQEGTTARNWVAGDKAANQLTAGAMANFIQPGQISNRTLLTADTSFYSNWGSGSDSSGDGTSGNPWKSIQHAWDTINHSYDGGGHLVTIAQSNGADTQGLIATGGIPGCSTVILTVNGGITTGNNVGVWVTDGSDITIRGGTGTIVGLEDDVLCDVGSICRLSGVRLGACNTNKIHASVDSAVVIDGAYSSTGAAQMEWAADLASSIFINPSALLTLVGTPNYSVAFASALTGGFIDAATATFSGSATGKRYNTTTGGGIYVNGGGATFLPGNSGGTADAATFGWYA